uniref:BTB domain-containing protein n=1 Tax=Panagrolaimus sp. ES5 TaxID=591445 RepID=A0AC34FHT2_9BILA
MSVEPVDDNRKLFAIRKSFNFDKSFFVDRTSFLSKCQAVEEMTDVRWQLEMRQKRIPTKRDPAQWGMHVIVHSRTQIECEASFEIAGEENSVLKCYNGIVGQNGVKIGTDEFILHEDLMGKKSGFFENKKTKITVKVSFCFTSKAEEELNAPAKVIQPSDFAKRLQAHGPKDFKFFANNEFIEVHKSFLSLESSVFAAMFENQNFKETQTGEMHITDFGLGIVKAATDFCYGEDITSYMDMHGSLAADIYLFADKYDMKNLKASIEDYYSKKLTAYNVANILTAADKVNSVDLKAKCVNFVQCLPKKEKRSFLYHANLDPILRGLFF